MDILYSMKIFNMKTGIEVMGNNLENKAKFFAQYLGVKCLKNELLKNHIPPHKVGIENCKGLPQQFLELTPLSQISDEDLEKCYHLNSAFIGYGGTMDFKPFLDMAKHWINKEGIKAFLKCSYTVDYLRSKGYALPFHWLSIETLVEYGWIKLKQ